MPPRIPFHLLHPFPLQPLLPRGPIHPTIPINNHTSRAFSRTPLPHQENNGNNNNHPPTSPIELPPARSGSARMVSVLQESLARYTEGGVARGGEGEGGGGGQGQQGQQSNYQASYQQQGYPQQGYGQQGYQQSYSQQSYPNDQQSYPQSPYPQSPYPPNNQQPSYPPNNQQPSYPPNNQQPSYPPNNQQPSYPLNNQQPSYPPLYPSQSPPSAYLAQTYTQYSPPSSTPPPTTGGPSPLTDADTDELYRNQRRFRHGQIYTPKDLSFESFKAARKRRTPSKDAFDTLGLNPLKEYKNFNLLSEYTTEMGRIKHRNDTGLRGVNQRKIAKAIRRAVGIGLLPSTHKHPELLKKIEENFFSNLKLAERGRGRGF